MKKLKCPECNTPFPVSYHFIKFRWKWLCPSCDIQIKLTTRSSQRIGAIAGLTFGLIILMVGNDFKIISPFFVGFLIFAYFYGRILTYTFGKFEKVTKTKSWDFFPNQTGPFKWCTIIGLVGCFIILPLFSLTLKNVEEWPVWVVIMLVVIVFVNFICLFLGGINMMFGKRGAFRRTDDKQDV